MYCEFIQSNIQYISVYYMNETSCTLTFVFTHTFLKQNLFQDAYGVIYFLVSFIKKKRIYIY